MQQIGQLNDTLDRLHAAIRRISEPAAAPARPAAECQSCIAMQTHAALAALQERLVAMVARSLGHEDPSEAPDPDAGPLRQVTRCQRCGTASP